LFTILRADYHRVVPFFSRAFLDFAADSSFHETPPKKQNQKSLAFLSNKKVFDEH